MLAEHLHEPQQVELAEIEVGVDRIDALDDRQLRRLGLNQVADVDQVAADVSADRGANLGVAEVELGAADGGLGEREARLGRFDLRGLRVELGLRDRLLRDERLDPRVFALGEFDRRLGTFELGLGRFERDLVGACSMTNKQVALFDRGAVFKQDLFEIAVDPGTQVDRRRGRGAADEFDRIGDRLFDRLGDRDLRRRRRDEFVLRLAAGENEHQAANR